MPSKRTSLSTKHRLSLSCYVVVGSHAGTENAPAVTFPGLLEQREEMPTSQHNLLHASSCHEA